MKKGVLAIGLGILLVAGLAVGLFVGKRDERPRIGVIVPIEHQAMRSMIGGFKEELQKRVGDDVRVDVMNAQGDSNLQQAIVEKFQRGNYDVVIPIGTDVTRQTMHTIRSTPVLGLDVTRAVDTGSHHVTGVLEADVDPSVEFIRAVMPDVKKVTVIYHPAEKISRQVARLKELAEAQQLAVQQLAVQSLPDLYAISKGVDPDSDLLFILKDHLVVSGVGAVAQAAQELQIPVLTSDEGSVQDGAGVALGNRESDIGRQGARIAARILDGESPSAMPFAPTPEFTVFLNSKALATQGVDTEAFHHRITDAGYTIQEVGQ